MGSLVEKIKKGRPYLYWVQSARVEGKPRIVEQVYLGPKDRVLQEIKQAYTRGQAPGPSPLRQIRVKEFGASVWLWHWVRKLGLVEIVDRYVPAVESKRRTPLSVGQYLAIAAVNRSIEARSKRARYQHWYQDSVLSRLCPARAGDLSSQRFWDHMDQVEPEHIEAIEQELLRRLKELFPLGEETLLYDTTNYFTFIDTFNQRPKLPQRGHNKQKRHDLRQLSLALLEDEQTGLPLYHQCYAGNRPDVSHFSTAWEGMVQAWLKGLNRPARQMTLVFDAGQSSRNNVSALDEAAVHYVGALPVRWVPEFLSVPRETYQPLEQAGPKHVKVYRSRRLLWKRERTVVVVFSPSFFCRQRAAMNRLQQKVDQNLQELAGQIAAGRNRSGKGHQKSSVEKKIRGWTARDHLREFLEVELETAGKRVTGLHWRWDLQKKRGVQRRYLGKTVLFTDQDHWTSQQMVSAYRRLTRQEQTFALSKARSNGPWWPMFHWTDSKIRVHALYCHFALLLLAILQTLLRQSGIELNAPRAIGRLEKIYETRVIYANGVGERVLSELDEDQRPLAKALGLFELAREVGTTPLEPA